MLHESNLCPAKSKNRLFEQSRRWHRWGGLLAGVFLFLVGITGAVLNYKQPVFSTLGIDLKRERDVSPFTNNQQSGKANLTTAAGISGGAVGFDQALAGARTEWGDVPLERIELREERGQLTWRIKQKGGGELWVNAVTGDRFAKGEYERIGKPDKDSNVAHTTDWGKILIDLHTGKIGGEIGKALITSAAVLLLLLTLSGFYLWLKPLLVRRQNYMTKSGRA